MQFRITGLLLLGAMALGILCGCKKAPPTLSLLVWEGYADPATVRAFDKDTGKVLWSVRYPALGSLDYGNSPRATPVIANGISIRILGLSVTGCRVLCESNTRRIQRIRSIANVFLQALIIPRRLY